MHLSIFAPKGGNFLVHERGCRNLRIALDDHDISNSVRGLQLSIVERQVVTATLTLELDGVHVDGRVLAELHAIVDRQPATEPRIDVFGGGDGADVPPEDLVIAEGELPPDLICDLLHLVDKAASPAVIAGWPQETRRAVQEWAQLVHLAASDNDDIVPEQPEVLVDRDGHSWSLMSRTDPDPCAHCGTLYSPDTRDEPCAVRNRQAES